MIPTSLVSDLKKWNLLGPCRPLSGSMTWRPTSFRLRLIQRRILRPFAARRRVGLGSTSFVRLRRSPLVATARGPARAGSIPAVERPSWRTLGLAHAATTRLGDIRPGAKTAGIGWHGKARPSVCGTPLTARAGRRHVPSAAGTAALRLPVAPACRHGGARVVDDARYTAIEPLSHFAGLPGAPGCHP